MSNLQQWKSAGELRRTKNIKTNTSVLKSIFLNQLITDWRNAYSIIDVKLRIQTEIALAIPQNT